MVYQTLKSRSGQKVWNYQRKYEPMKSNNFLVCFKTILARTHILTLIDLEDKQKKKKKKKKILHETLILLCTWSKRKLEGGGSYSVVVNVLVCDIVRTPVALLCSLSDLYPAKRYKSPYPSTSYGLNSATTITHESWYAIKQKKNKPQTNQQKLY